MEREYISYLLENLQKDKFDIVVEYLDSKIEFSDLVDNLDVTECDVLSYKSFVKGKKIDSLTK